MSTDAAAPALDDDLVDVAPADWDQVLATVGADDVYLRRAYVEAATLLEPGQPVLLHLAGDGGHVLHAFILRALPGDHDGGDVVTPYGYGGPVVVGANPPVERFHELFAQWCRHNAVVSSFVRFHPLLANQRFSAAGMRLSPLAGTVAWNLAPERDLLGAMHGKHRNVVRKAQGAGVTVQVHEAPRDLSRFVELYEHTMRRQQAGSFYFFGRPYWSALEGELAPSVVLFEATHEGETIASALCLRGTRWLHYHLGATADSARALGASNLVLYEAARWAQGQHFTQLHLGGGVGGAADSLLAFKRRFDPDGLRPAFVGRQVHDAARYRELAGTDDVDGFFPAYRRPPGS